MSCNQCNQKGARTHKDEIDERIAELTKRFNADPNVSAFAKLLFNNMDTYVKYSRKQPKQ